MNYMQTIESSDIQLQKEEQQNVTISLKYSIHTHMNTKDKKICFSKSPFSHM